MPVLRILHLVGSACDDFYCDLSCAYARSGVTNLAKLSSLYEFHIALITPDDQWRFPQSLSSEHITAAKSISLSDAIKYIMAQKIDLVIPHMYCIPGMTHYRALFDLLKIPYLGNTPDVMATVAHKGKAKAIVAAAGVKVPLVRCFVRDIPTISPPAIVKPVSADNSLGVSLVKEDTDYDAALKGAFKYADEVVVETFIEAGREVRCYIIVKDGRLIALPLEEFLIDPLELPVRSYSEKFPRLDENGNAYGRPINHVQRYWITDSSDPTTEKVQEMAKKCHFALGCRHYSMFEFRIDPNGEPWFLEAGLYCSFNPGEVLLAWRKSSEYLWMSLLKAMIKETLSTI